MDRLAIPLDGRLMGPLAIPGGGDMTMSPATIRAARRRGFGALEGAA